MLRDSLIKFWSALLLIIICINHCHKGSITIIDASDMQKTQALKAKLKLFTNKAEKEKACVKYTTWHTSWSYTIFTSLYIFATVFFQIVFHLFPFVALRGKSLSCHLYFANWCSGWHSEDVFYQATNTCFLDMSKIHIYCQRWLLRVQFLLFIYHPVLHLSSRRQYWCIPLVFTRLSSNLVCCW